MPCWALGEPGPAGGGPGPARPHILQCLPRSKRQLHQRTPGGFRSPPSHPKCSAAWAPAWNRPHGSSRSLSPSQGWPGFMFPCPDSSVSGACPFVRAVVNDTDPLPPRFLQIIGKDVREQAHQEPPSGQHQFSDRSLYAKVLPPVVNANASPRLSTGKQKPRQMSTVSTAHPPIQLTNFTGGPSCCPHWRSAGTRHASALADPNGRFPTGTGSRRLLSKPGHGWGWQRDAVKISPRGKSEQLRTVTTPWGSAGAPGAWAGTVSTARVHTSVDQEASPHTPAGVVQ